MQAPTGDSNRFGGLAAIIAHLADVPKSDVARLASNAKEVYTRVVESQQRIKLHQKENAGLYVLLHYAATISHEAVDAVARLVQTKNFYTEGVFFFDNGLLEAFVRAVRHWPGVFSVLLDRYTNLSRFGKSLRMLQIAERAGPAILANFIVNSQFERQFFQKANRMLGAEGLRELHFINAAACTQRRFGTNTAVNTTTLAVWGAEHVKSLFAAIRVLHGKHQSAAAARLGEYVARNAPKIQLPLRPLADGLAALLPLRSTSRILVQVIKTQPEEECIQLLESADSLGIQLLNRVVEEEQQFVEQHCVHSEFVIQNPRISAIVRPKMRRGAVAEIDGTADIAQFASALASLDTATLTELQRNRLQTTINSNFNLICSEMPKSPHRSALIARVAELTPQRHTELAGIVLAVGKTTKESVGAVLSHSSCPRNFRAELLRAAAGALSPQHLTELAFAHDAQDMLADVPTIQTHALSVLANDVGNEQLGQAAKTRLLRVILECCSICCERNDHATIITQCNHVFHYRCLKTWGRTNCPQCKREIEL